MERGDIYLVSLDPNRGHEQRGRRPVLVVSPDAFNQLTRVPIVVPITTGGNFARIAGSPYPSPAPAPAPWALSGAISRERSTLAHGARIDEALAKLVPLFD
jgi:hypothetical protein